MKIELNPNLDIESLKQQFSDNQKVRIANLLTLESAEYILENLKNQTAWHLVFTQSNGKLKRLNSSELEALSEEQYQEIFSQLHSTAASKYQFIYKFFPIIGAIKDGILPEASMLYQTAAFFNGSEFLKFARELTSTNTVVKADTQASLYEPGHFLNAHDDLDPSDSSSSTRRFAIVAGFTKNWSPNWGGQTNFYKSASDSAFESWNPGFNTLTIFSVPVLHGVSYVAPFAAKGRYSITGWLRDDPSISRPDLGDV